MSQPKKMIRSEEATVLLLDKMLQEIKRVSDQTNQSLQLIKQQIPEGIIDNKIVTATTKELSIVPPLDKCWFSISIVSDGPDPCFVVVNTEKSNTNPSLLNVNETFEIDLGVPKIVDALVWCAVGSANLRVRGVR